jgi:hypothetical protein
VTLTRRAGVALGASNPSDTEERKERAEPPAGDRAVQLQPIVEPEVLVDADLNTLATELCVRADDLLKSSAERAPWRP